MTELDASDPSIRAFLRHALATLAYRAGKTVRGIPEEFGRFRATPQSTSVVEILAHMGDLMAWALSMVEGKPSFNQSTPLPWDEEIRRFFTSLGALDAYLASGAPIHYEPARLFQSALADALTHTGQLAMLRRLSGFKMKGESYNRADIRIGRVGLDQTPPDPKFEFD